MSTTETERNFYPATIRNMYLNQVGGLPVEVKEDLDNSVEFARQYLPDHIERGRIREVQTEKDIKLTFAESRHIKDCEQCSKLMFPDHVYGHKLEQIRDGLAPDDDEHGHIRWCKTCQRDAGMQPKS